jgi:NAD(P)-dependent dehydrogenase (short-subunit alcohol dehydrogenase family)
MNPIASSSRPAVLVTGASRGIGRAIAQQLAGRGCRVAVHYQHNRAMAEALLAELPGGGHQAFAADLADPDAVARLWDQVSAAMGPIAVLVNNAGVYHFHPLPATGYADWRQAWRRTLDTNLLGPANLCHQAGCAMVAAGGGRVVSISSRGAFRGEPEAPAYAASKAGLNALSQSLARALAAQRVYFYVVAPGWAATDMANSHLEGPAGAEILAQHPLGRVASPEEVAAAAVFCALDAPAAMTGCIIDVNGASYLRT